jgi:hypothetical protein
MKLRCYGAVACSTSQSYFTYYKNSIISYIILYTYVLYFLHSFSELLYCYIIFIILAMYDNYIVTKSSFHKLNIIRRFHQLLIFHCIF